MSTKKGYARKRRYTCSQCLGPVMVYPALVLNKEVLVCEECQETEQEDIEAKDGDRVVCQYCSKEFTFTDPSSQQVGAGIFWCGCDEEEG